MSTLNEIRTQWERSLTPLVVLDQTQTHGRVLVILQYERPDTTGLTRPRTISYHCHRYFPIGEDWNCSVDGQSVPIEAVWSWLNKPAAFSTHPDHYVTPDPVTVEA